MIELRNVVKTYIVRNQTQDRKVKDYVDVTDIDDFARRGEATYEIKTRKAKEDIRSREKKIKQEKTAELHAVNGVSLTIEDGEIFGIIGYSGAGKSTMIRLINQLEKQTSGEIIIDGSDLSKLSEKELLKARSKIGMIFQHFNLLWSRTVRENIELPLEIVGIDKEKRSKRVNELITLVGLNGKEDSYPSELSGGQKQRIGIARALANNPSILLCDEATSALDPETTDSILDLLKSINRQFGITIVMITHQMQVVQKVCNRIAVMSDGRVVELATSQDIFERPQHEVTKRFVRDVDGYENIDEIVNELGKQYPNGYILRLIFSNDNSGEPILSRIIRKTNLDISIVHGSISVSSSGKQGSLYIHVNTDDSNLHNLQKLLEDNQVKWEVI